MTKPTTPEEREKLWQQPDWVCPQCRYRNLAIRSYCRNCQTEKPEALPCCDQEEETLP